jgi:hypothetical protein
MTTARGQHRSGWGGAWLGSGVGFGVRWSMGALAGGRR